MLKVFVPAIALLLAAPESGLTCESAVCRCVSAESYGVSEAEHVRRQRDAADRVVLGTVMRLDTLAPIALAGGTDVVSVRPIVARVRVRQVWRGPLVDTMTVTLATIEGQSSCDIEMQPSQSFVIFARRTESGPLATRQCMGTTEERAAAGVLEALGAGQAPQQ